MNQLDILRMVPWVIRWQIVCDRLTRISYQWSTVIKSDYDYHLVYHTLKHFCITYIPYKSTAPLAETFETWKRLRVAINSIWIHQINGVLWRNWYTKQVFATSNSVTITKASALSVLEAWFRCHRCTEHTLIRDSERKKIIEHETEYPIGATGLDIHYNS